MNISASKNEIVKKQIPDITINNRFWFSSMEVANVNLARWIEIPQ
jgi:hypothetical protein